jgi:signal transduction histidine kinase/CheY-like chemotaxis protein
MSKRTTDPAEPTGASTLDVEGDAFQLTLTGMVLPLTGHLVFNALGSLSAALLGHPIIAAAAFVACGLMDIIFQNRIGRWRRQGPEDDLDRSLRRLAVLCATRNTVLLAPAALMAILGGAPEVAYLGLVVAIIVVMASANGSLSRLVFWAYATPALVAFAVVAGSAFRPTETAALMIGLATLILLLALVSYGTTKAVGAWHAAFSARGTLIGDLEAARDQAIAERTAADEAREEARRANRAKSNFLATMSHEIRTPMNGVLGMAQLLRREESDPRQTERIDTLIESGEYLLAILNDILDVSKIDAGRMEITPHVADLRQFLDHTVAFWAPRADETGVALRLEITDDVPSHVWMDALRLQQVLFNLIGNALKFTAEGSVTLIVDGVMRDESACTVRLTVRDTGPGIAAEHLPALFERFSQADDSEVRQFGGTGLGLAIARQLTELMGGSIGVESQLGAGSSFQVELPLDLAQSPGADEDQPEAEAPAEVDRLSILIVDDNPTNLMVLEQVLRALGHDTVKATDGPDALDLCGSQAFDLAVMDIQMPGMSGVEVLRRLRGAPGPNRRIPVVALTADVTSGGRAHYLGAGFNEHCSKPIQIPELMGAIGRAVASTGAPEGEARRTAGGAS